MSGREDSQRLVYEWEMQWTKCSPSNRFYYNMKKGVMWLGRDEHVEPEVTVRNFGPTGSRWPRMMSQRIEGVRRYDNVWNERGNMIYGQGRR